MPRTLLLTRHAESVWNSLGIYQGRLESELSALGEQQAVALGQRLRARPPETVYSSPARRAMRTAELVLEQVGEGKLVAHQALLEIDHGAWSGLGGAEVARRWPELVERWRTNPESVRMPGGESLLEVRQRSLTFLSWLRQEHAEGRILIVTHGTVLRLLLGYLLEMRPNQLWSVDADNCTLSVVDDYDVPLIMAINDSCHLEGVRSTLSAQVR